MGCSCLPRLDPVYSAAVALGLGCIGVALSFQNGGSVMPVVEGFGSGASVLEDSVWIAVNLSLLFVLVDFISVIIICASTFDRVMELLHVPHFVTTSRFLSYMQLVLWACFVAQTVLSQLVLLAYSLFASLLYVCSAGQSQQGHVQSLLNDLAAAPSSTVYNPLGSEPAHRHVLDTPVVSLQAILGGLNVERFCDSANVKERHDDLGHLGLLVYLGTLLLAVAQAAMASALASETERVVVHESAAEKVAEASMQQYQVAGIDVAKLGLVDHATHFARHVEIDGTCEY